MYSDVSPLLNEYNKFWAAYEVPSNKILRASPIFSSFAHIISLFSGQSFMARYQKCLIFKLAFQTIDCSDGDQNNYITG